MYKKLFSFKQKEIRSVFAKARHHKSVPGFKLLRAPFDANPEHPLSNGKLLIVTPKKSGKAHDRNKIKRQIKAIFYEEKLYEKPGYWVLLVYKEAMELSFEEIKAFLTASLGRSCASRNPSTSSGRTTKDAGDINE